MLPLFHLTILYGPVPATVPASWLYLGYVIASPLALASCFSYSLRAFGEWIASAWREKPPGRFAEGSLTSMTAVLASFAVQDL